MDLAQRQSFGIQQTRSNSYHVPIFIANQSSFNISNQTLQQFELGTNRMLNQTNQLLGDYKLDQLPSFELGKLCELSALWVRCRA